MHLVDLEKGFLGSSAIVGNSIPIGVGVGYAKQLSGDSGVSYVFLGEAATEEGSFYESANFAVVHKLPVVFVLENNLYSVYTSLSDRQPSNRTPSQLASAIGLRSELATDSDFEGAFAKLSELTKYSREGNGPSLIEISTYRTLEHCGPNDDDDLGYRPKDEIAKFKDVDLIQNLEEMLGLTTQEKQKIASEILEEISRAVDFAESSPFPTYAEATGDVYAN